MRKTLGAILLALAMTVLPGTVFAAVPPADALVKASGPAVYYEASDGKRYVFPNAGTYASWFRDFTHVVTVRDDELATMQLGGNVTDLTLDNAVPNRLLIGPAWHIVLSWDLDLSYVEYAIVP